MEECLNTMKPVLAGTDHHGSMTENNLFSLAEQNKITILEYIDNKLVYWSDNEFDVPLFYLMIPYSARTWYFFRTAGFPENDQGGK